MTPAGDRERFERFEATLCVFLNLPGVEEEIRGKIDALAGQIFNYSDFAEGTEAPEEVLANYFSVDFEERLKILLGISGGSLERLRRVFLALFPERSWKDIARDGDLRRKIALFMIRPEMYPLIPLYIQDSFRLPANWSERIKDKDQIRAIANEIFGPRYAVAVGAALEHEIAKEVRRAGFAFEKGAVGIVDHKEVDLAVPNLEAPQILIMSSYSVTTSSSQSSRANEQARMYEDIQHHNQRRKDYENVKMVNVIDGGGWISRRRDLEKMFKNSDACFSHATLNELGDFLTENSWTPRKRN